MRTLDIGTQKRTKVVSLDEPGQDGACHKYEILSAEQSDTPAVFGCVYFQDGPVGKVGVNGCHQEDLLAIVIDRLQHFQKGDYVCKENALALIRVEEALLWLRHRTDSRAARGVKGTSQI